MSVKDLTDLLTPPLPLAIRGKKYTVPPPDAAAGRLLGRLLAIGMRAAAAGDDSVDLDAEVSDGFTEQEIAALDKPGALERLALSDQIYEQMVADGWPGPDIVKFGRYAALYWIFGEEVADRSMFPTSADAGAAFPKASKTGPRTASGNRTKTASTKATGRSRTTSATPSTRKSAKPKGRA